MQYFAGLLVVVNREGYQFIGATAILFHLAFAARRLFLNGIYRDILKAYAAVVKGKNTTREPCQVGENEQYDYQALQITAITSSNI